MSEIECKRGVRKTGEPYRVMVVDDSVFIQKQMSMMLTSEGFEVFAKANNGEEALAIYQNNKDKIDLVTMDITMPKMDGITALGKLIEFDPKVIVIMVSALGKEDLVKKSLLLGAKNYVVKPLSRDKVIGRIVSIVEDI